MINEEDHSFWEDMYTYRGLIPYDTLIFITPATVEAELTWATRARQCFACGRIHPDCELTWKVDVDELTEAKDMTDQDLRALCRPRRWICAFDFQSSMQKVLCPSCYRLVQFECIDGVWDPDFMAPYRLQMILPFSETNEC